MSVVDLLRQVSIFADLRAEDLNALAACLGKRTFARGMMLYQKGSDAQSLYLIESGEVRIFALSDTGREITLEVHGPGDCFGERALLDGNLRTTGAMALEKTVTYTLGRDDFLRCLERYPQVTRRLTALLSPSAGACHQLRREPGFPGRGRPGGGRTVGTRRAPRGRTRQHRDQPAPDPGRSGDLGLCHPGDGQQGSAYVSRPGDHQH